MLRWAGMDPRPPPFATPEEPTPPSRTAPWSVSRLVAVLDGALREAFASVWVEGEVLDLTTPASGHRYFSIRDERAMIRCVLFARSAPLSAALLVPGRTVLIHGRVGLYQARGSLQIVVDHVEEGGEGARRRQLEELKKALAAEGLFRALEDRRPLPTLPRRIAVVTSPSGAAVRDVLRVLGRRLPLVPVRLYAASVQGVHAPLEIAAAFARLAERRDADLVLLVRGGGSSEDLSAFNTREVVTAVRRCPVPVVTGIGHEIDRTLADLAADLDGTTPSGAAERAVPDRSELLGRLTALRERLLARHPRRRLEERLLRLDERAGQLASSVKRRLARPEAILALWKDRSTQPLPPIEKARRRLEAVRPDRLALGLDLRFAGAAQRTALLGGRLEAALRRTLSETDTRVTTLGGTLRGLDPHAVLARGYALVFDRDGRLLRGGAGLATGSPLVVEWKDARVPAVTTAPATPLVREER
jgi:exodeoxyribonuclease VII large subunit